MRRILVLRGGALGDLLVTLPALALLRERWPGATIELAGNATAAALARQRGLVDVVHSQEERRWSAFYAGDPLPAALAAWLAGFDLVLSYWPDPDGDLRRHFPARAGQLFLSAAALPGCAPAAAHYCQPLADLGLPPRELLYPLANHRAPAAGETARIFIHPGSGSPRKNWPAERWRELISRLPGPVDLILGEAEAADWASVAVAADRHRQRPLEELVGLLARCRLFLGHDSGISHLAAACGAPSVLLFGPTDPAMWAPPGPQVRVLRRSDDLRALTVDDVLQAALSALASAP